MLGTTTVREVRELFGPPAARTHYARLERDIWEYPMEPYYMPYVLYVHFSADGVVREVFKMPDYKADPYMGSLPY